MALSILSSPVDTASVSNEMLFIINEATKANDETTYPNYKYVLDIYISAVLVARMKATPDPVNRFGIFDVSSVLKDYAPEYGLTANYANHTETYDVKAAYTCKLGEEYGDTLYTNLVTDSERTAYRTYTIKPKLTTNPIVNKIANIASNMPDIDLAHLNGYKQDKWFIVPYIDNVSGVTSILYEFHDSNGSVVGSPGTIAYTVPMINKILQINMGFLKLVDVLGLSAAQKNSIKSLHFNTDNTFDGGEFYVVDYTCTKYPVITLAWLNPYGAYESYSFGLVSKKTKQISRKEFSRLNYEINASGVVSYDNNGVMYGSKRGFSAHTKCMMRLTSHLLNQYEYDWLADLFSSPDVYMYDSVIDRFVPVTITDTSYEHRTYLNSKVTPLEFALEFSDQYNSQLL